MTKWPTQKQTAQDNPQDKAQNNKQELCLDKHQCHF